MEDHGVATHTIRTLLRRLSQAGFSREFIRRAVLPDWWEPSCERDPSLLSDVEVRIARFLGISAADLREPQAPLVPPSFAHARLRKVKNVNRDQLGPAIHTGVRVAEAVVRSLRNHVGAVGALPRDAQTWWNQLRDAHGTVGLDTVAEDLWAHGIPVVHLAELPSPKFQGLSCIVSGRPVIVLGHSNDEPARLAYVITHEAGHVTSGDCAAGEPVVDQDEEVLDESPSEVRADEYAWRALTGGTELQDFDPATSWKVIANEAATLEVTRHVDAGVAVWFWANRTRRFADGQMALKALYRSHGGRHVLRDLFDRHVDLDAASETDQGLLGCVSGSVRRDAPAP